MNDKNMMHGCDWTGQSLAGWIASEKLDGCRAYWDGKTMWSRGGLVIQLPQHIIDQLPDFHLDGEIYAGPGTRAKVSGVMFSGRWGVLQPRFVAFDAPKVPCGYADRIAAAREVYSDCVETKKLSGQEDAFDMLQKIIHSGGEGIMVQSPSAGYQAKRLHSILKIKSLDAFCGVFND